MAPVTGSGSCPAWIARVANPRRSSRRSATRLGRHLTGAAAEVETFSSAPGDEARYRPQFRGIAAETRGWACPSDVTAIPFAKSRYERPSTS